MFGNSFTHGGQKQLPLVFASVQHGFALHVIFDRVSKHALSDGARATSQVQIMLKYTNK